MSSIGLLSVLCVFAATSLSQDEPDSTLFDFWVGEWDLEWTNSDGSKGKGYNNVSRILDGKIIHEDFKVLSGKYNTFQGRSFSVLDAWTRRWKQTWVDNQQSYLDFVGYGDGGKRIFRREITKDGKPLFQRMVFHSITEGQFLWDWEASTDSSKTWTLNWRIQYKRRTPE